MFQLPRRQRPEPRDIHLFKELAADRALHVGGHRLHRFLADFGKVAGLVDHAPELAAHPDRTRLARILRAQGLPHRPPADAVGQLERVADGPPATTAFSASHEVALALISRSTRNRHPRTDTVRHPTASNFNSSSSLPKWPHVSARAARLSHRIPPARCTMKRLLLCWLLCFAPLSRAQSASVDWRNTDVGGRRQRRPVRV